ncbi:hypothetical protein C8R43DRAFT_314481 [Mycena crocata]|nr:hypothetical protein C8R43DRAFT_314481 [Mycena crocata]
MCGDVVVCKTISNRRIVVLNWRAGKGFLLNKPPTQFSFGLLPGHILIANAFGEGLNAGRALLHSIHALTSAGFWVPANDFHYNTNVDVRSPPVVLDFPLDGTHQAVSVSILPSILHDDSYDLAIVVEAAEDASLSRYKLVVPPKTASSPHLTLKSVCHHPFTTMTRTGYSFIRKKQNCSIDMHRPA